MDTKWFKVGGVIAIVVGSAALYLAGTAESTVVAIVAGVFILAGVIAGLFTLKAKK